jgi:hypothetical protein
MLTLSYRVRFSLEEEKVGNDCVQATWRGLA